MDQAEGASEEWVVADSDDESAVEDTRAAPEWVVASDDDDDDDNGGGGVGGDWVAYESDGSEEAGQEQEQSEWVPHQSDTEDEGRGCYGDDDLGWQGYATSPSDHDEGETSAEFLDAIAALPPDVTLAPHTNLTMGQVARGAFSDPDQ